MNPEENLNEVREPKRARKFVQQTFPMGAEQLFPGDKACRFPMPSRMPNASKLTAPAGRGSKNTEWSRDHRERSVLKALCALEGFANDANLRDPKGRFGTNPVSGVIAVRLPRYKCHAFHIEFAEDFFSKPGKYLWFSYDPRTGNRGRRPTDI